MSMITINLKSNSKQPYYTQIYEHIKQEIKSGALTADDKLPSKRKLSSYLQTSQNTVQAAYDQLMTEGYIYSQPKSGYYVSTLDGLLQINSAKPEKEKESKSNYQYDFSYRGVDLESFPFSVWRKLYTNVLNEYDKDFLVQGDSQGLPGLRESITHYLHQSRGVACNPEQIIISSGTEFLMQLLIQLVGRDRTFALENPGYEKLHLLFESNQAAFVPIPVDKYGMIPEELNDSGADLACITPSHQFPTGEIMPIQRRIQMLNWANEATGRYIIEDDYDSEFKYSGKPIPALQGLDESEKVIYLGSFSKSLNPGIRISYMVLPEDLLQEYLDRLKFYICPVPVAEQKTLQQFIDKGYFERHLNRMRTIYKRKRALLVSEIHNCLIHTLVFGANAGLHILLQVDNGMTEEELLLSADAEGVKVYGISEYYLDLRNKNIVPTVLLGFASMSEREIKEAIQLLKKAWYL